MKHQTVKNKKQGLNIKEDHVQPKIKNLKESNMEDKLHFPQSSNNVLNTKKSQNDWISLNNKIPIARHHTLDPGKQEKKNGFQFLPQRIDTQCARSPVTINQMEIFQDDFSILKVHDSDITKEEVQKEKKEMDSECRGDMCRNEKQQNTSKTGAESETSAFLNYNLCESKCFTILENISMSVTKENGNNITSTAKANILPILSEETEQSHQSVNIKDFNTQDFLSQISKPGLNNVSTYHNLLFSAFTNSRCKFADSCDNSAFPDKKSNIELCDSINYSGDTNEFENNNEDDKQCIYPFTINNNSFKSHLDVYKLNCILKYICHDTNKHEYVATKNKNFEDWKKKKISCSSNDFTFIPKHSEIETFKLASPPKRGDAKNIPHFSGARCSLKVEVPTHRRKYS